MVIFVACSMAFAADPPAPPSEPGTLRVDARMPAEVLIDGAKVAQLWYAGEVSFEVPAGAHELRVYTSGSPTDLNVDVPSGEELRVMVGRTGVTLDQPVAGAAPDPNAPVSVEFRCSGAGAMVRIGDERLVMTGGQRLSLELAPGTHPLSVRNPEGTVIWASGTLEVQPQAGLVVQVADGRMPELFGPGQFYARGG